MTYWNKWGEVLNRVVSLKRNVSLYVTLAQRKCVIWSKRCTICDDGLVGNRLYFT